MSANLDPEDTSFKVFMRMNWVRDENACSSSLLLFLFRCSSDVMQRCGHFPLSAGLALIGSP